MKPVDQATGSDCLRACFASIFELPLLDVPAFGARSIGLESAGMDQDSDCRKWLALRGLSLQHVTNPEILFRKGATSAPGPWGYCVAGGKSPRGDFDHAVVYQIQDNIPALVHDPHVSRAGLDGEATYFTCFQMKDPGKWINWCNERRSSE